MLKNSKLKFSEYIQNISRSKSFGTFVLIAVSTKQGGRLFEIFVTFSQYINFI